MDPGPEAGLPSDRAAGIDELAAGRAYPGEAGRGYFRVIQRLCGQWLHFSTSVLEKHTLRLNSGRLISIINNYDSAILSPGDEYASLILMAQP